MNNLQRLIALASMSLALDCAAKPYWLDFDVEHAFFETVLRENVDDEGRLSCDVKIAQAHRGEKWTPSVILAAAEDAAEDDTLFLTGSLQSNNDLAFSLRTFNAARPVLNETFMRTDEHQDTYRLTLAWHKDGSITYQVASAQARSAEQVVREPGFTVRHVSVHASGVAGRATCQLDR